MEDKGVACIICNGKQSPYYKIDSSPFLRNSYRINIVDGKIGTEVKKEYTLCK